MGTILVHGGASTIARQDVGLHEACCRRAVARGLEVLREGGSALDAAVEAVVVLEDDPCTNAGTGAVPNRDGEIELDALAMEGTALGLGAVGAVRDVKNPIRLARELVSVPDLNLLVGDGASRFARSVGIPPVDPRTLLTQAQRERFERSRHAAAADTVGAVVCDDAGHTACAVSTGGVPGKHPGRVGDTPLAGSGGYADDRIGAAVATGVGEGIMRVLLSRAALDALARGLSPDEAARAAVALLAERVGGRGGIILVTPSGQSGFAFNTPQMSHAYGSAAGTITAGH